MVRTSVRDRLRSRGTDRVVWPDYGGYSFHRTVPTAMAALGADVGQTLPDDAQPVATGSVDRVAFVLVDALGLDRWTAASDPLTERFDRAGTVTPLTSVYPSETAAAIPSMHTATPPAVNGTTGWNQWVERVGTSVQPLPFTADGRPAGEAGVEAGDVFVGDSVYADAAAQGVESAFVVPEAVTSGPASERFAAGAGVAPYSNLADMARRAREHLAEPGTFAYCYVSEVDASGHRHGIDSAPTRAQRRLVAYAVGRELLDRLDPGVAERTLVVVTADHGQFDTTGAVDLREVPAVWDNRAAHDGEPVPPTGSARNVHLRLADGAVESARAAIEDAVDCTTFTRETALDRGLFGPEPGERIRRRCADLVVVPHEVGVWHDPAMLEYVGMHGGLSPEEMLVPFAVGRASELRR
jgi:hypothetical protein